MQIDVDPTVLRIISCYAPQTNCPDEEKTEFWRALDDHLQTISPEEHVAVGGDLNGHVGKGRDGYHRFHGGQRFGTRNDDGCRVLDYAEAHDLAVTNTFFKKKPAHLITYSSGGRDTQIDYWLVRRPHLSLVTNVKVIPSTNIGPQHRLLVMDLRLHLGQRRRRTPTTTVEKIKWWRLPECKQQLMDALEHLDVDSNEPVDKAWENIASQIRDAAGNTLGATKPGKHFIDKQVWWWNDSVQQTIKEKKSALKVWLQSHSDGDYQQYRALRSAAKKAWKTRLADFGLRLNTNKTKYLEAGPQTDGTISIDGEDLAKVPHFKYLGSMISNDGDILLDVRARINAAWMKWRQVTGVLCDRRMPNRLKSKIYKSVVRPVALHGSECWPATAKHEQALHTMEMRMLRWCLGLTRWDHVMNTDVRKRMGIAPITDKMQEARLRWYGHVVRSDENSVVRTALRLSPQGRRPRGRPKRRWMDRIKDDVKKIEADLTDALDRPKWRRLCRKADPATEREKR
ncbi:uncharacterized protein LOC113033277 [Astatotilapia calliptera]|uniref:uncharacterized protein LOC113033277 n=1 Tax=Astatotilapia calliptera TaxID=8154 RepID=UPI000E40F421|nr:uncharacterized protein LOC113033277 [Astatotilapia calliptera]